MTTTLYPSGQVQQTSLTGSEQVEVDGGGAVKSFATTQQIANLGNTTAPQIITAAGTTQLGATAITGKKAFVTVAATASTHGVRLPAGVTGTEILITNTGSFNVKVYPSSNGKIGAAATNAADSPLLAVNNANRYTAINKTLWVVTRSLSATLVSPTISSPTITTPTITGGTTTGGTVTNQIRTGTLSVTPQNVTAAGTTQLGATAITSQKAVITVSTTASTHGVRLPKAATGLEVEVANAGTYGVKVYPTSNGKIGAASTNAADVTVLAVNKSNLYIAVNTNLWVVRRGA